MGKYLPADSIACARERLGDSKAESGLLDFLVLKRTMVLDDSERANTSSRHPAFRQAIHELMACYPLSLEQLANYPRPFINAFGTANHSTRGYRSGRYLTNGTASTVKNWTNVVQIVDRSPIVVTWHEDYVDNLPDWLLKQSGGPLREIDAAIWYLRYRDLDEIPVSEVTVEESLTALQQIFVEEIGLTEPERARLFQTLDAEET